MSLDTALIADWRARAACRNEGTDKWFPVLTAPAAVVEAAKAICATCPVTQECLQAGAGEEGIWGGLTEEERNALGRRRGRPPKKPRVNHGCGNGAGHHKAGAA
jgi:WhiB family redox-sensing transcriptional regulator